jgi:hypothetical protein
MRNSWLWIVAVTGLLAGCSSGSQLPLSASGGSESNTVARASQTAPGVHDDRRKRKLVYISSVYTSEVGFYKWESTKLKGTITGLEDPQDMCSGSGHVWISNTDAADLAEYAAGGTTEIGSLADPGYYPIDCSVDPTTGNLAVANIFSTSDSTGKIDTGNVEIYAHASGVGTAYTVPNIAEPFFLAYDDKGNLFVDGHPSLFGSGFGFAELAAGTGSFKAVTLNKTIEFPGPIQWDGTYVATDDQEGPLNTIYRFKIVGSKGRLKQTVGVSDCSPLGWSVASSTLVCGVAGSLGSGDLYYYVYPAGGQPIKTETIAGLKGVVGVMVTEEQP